MTETNVKTATIVSNDAKMKSKDHGITELSKDQKVTEPSKNQGIIELTDQKVTELSKAQDQDQDQNQEIIELKKEQGNYIGFIASLHTHSFKPGELMKQVQKMQLVVDKGILNNPRYFDTINRTSGYQNRNHLSLIERDQITDLVEEMAAYEELSGSGKKTPDLLPGIIRSNVEIIAHGLFMTDIIGSNVRIGNMVVINIYKARVTCKRMDEIYPGLRAMTRNNKLGVIAEIIKGGEIKVGDQIYVMN